MSDQELERLVDAVTRRVLSALRQESGDFAPPEERGETLLVIGAKEHVPKPFRGGVLCGMEDYRAFQDIRRYRRVVVTALSINQLADVAQGRWSDAEGCAIVQALLHGVEVLMLDSALPHRRFAGMGSAGLCRLLEGYVRTIQTFGIRLLGADGPPPPLAGPVECRRPAAPPSGPRRSRLVTEADALDLVKAEAAVRLPAGAVLTPSARDVFAHAGVAVALDDESLF